MPSGDARVRASRVHAHGALVHPMDSIGARGTAAAAAEPLARSSACAAAWHSCACTPLARTHASRGLNGTKAIGRRAAQHRINEFKRHATHNAGARVRNARRIWQLMWTPHPRSRPAPRGSRPARMHTHMSSNHASGMHVHSRGPSLPHRSHRVRSDFLGSLHAFASSTYIQSSVVASGCAALVPARAASRARIAAVNLSDATA